MATTTPNFGWSVPTSSDLVKNGAVAIETLGDSIDASLVDLKGGTTGQVLSKASNTDLDFSWASAGSSGSMTSIASGNLPTGSTTLSLTSISGSYTHLQLVVYAWNGSGNNNLQARINNDTGSNYGTYNLGHLGGTSRQNGYINETSIKLSYGDAALSGNNKNITVMDFPFYTNATTGKTYSAISGFLGSDSNRGYIKADGYYYGTNAAITRLDFFYGSNWSGGTYVLYGVN
jgi:hypothetical protein